MQTTARASRVRTPWIKLRADHTSLAGLFILTVALSGCGGGGEDSIGGPDADDDLGELALLSFNFEDTAGIFRDGRIELNFNGPLAIDSVKSSTIHIFIDRDQDATTNPPCNPLDGDQPGEWVAGSFFVGLNQVTFVPNDFFNARTVYCIAIPSAQEDAIAPGGPGVLPLIRNVQGNPMVNQYEAFFITGDGFSFSNQVSNITPGSPTSPGTLGVDPNTCIDVTHSRPINQATVNNGTFQVVDQSTGTAVPGTFTFPGPSTFTFCPLAPFSDATIHIITVTSGIEDTSGIGSNGGVFFFTTEFPPPDGNTTFFEDFVNNFLEETAASQLPPGVDRADWNASQGTAGGVAGRLAGAVGPLLPLGGQGNADLMILTGTFHDIDVDQGLVDGAPSPTVGGTPSFLGEGVFQFRNIEIGGTITLEAFGSFPLVLQASGTITIDGVIDIHGDDGGTAIAGPNMPGGSPAVVRRAGGLPGGAGAPSNGTQGLNGSNAELHSFPAPASLGEGGGCGGESIIDPVAGEIGEGGGGGGYFQAGWSGVTAINGVRTWRTGLGTVGICEPSKGGLQIQRNPNLQPLASGSGGGGGASISDTPGGGGATGGGSMALICAGIFSLNGQLIAYGGHGGDVLNSSTTSPGLAGGGGGGSGGGILIQSATLIDAVSGIIDVTYGDGGRVPPPIYSAGGPGGGHGAPGRIIFEAPAPLMNTLFPPPAGAMLPTNSPVLTPAPIGFGSVQLNPPSACQCFAPTANFPTTINQAATFCAGNVLVATQFYQANFSVGQSVWFRVTNNGIPVGLPGAGAAVRHPNYTGSSATLANVPAGGTVLIEWMGAEESGPGTGLPRNGTQTPWTTNIDLLDTHELVRFRVSITTETLPDLGGAPPVAGVLDISLDYTFNN